jgi:hypothetical protein
MIYETFIAPRERPNTALEIKRAAALQALPHDARNAYGPVWRSLNNLLIARAVS